MIKVNMNVLFEERLLDLDAITDNKVRLLRQNRGRDQPIKRQRLSRSMIWDKYTFLAINEKEIQKSMSMGGTEEHDENFEYKKRIEEEE